MFQLKLKLLVCIFLLGNLFAATDFLEDIDGDKLDELTREIQSQSFMADTNSDYHLKVRDIKTLLTSQEKLTQALKNRDGYLEWAERKKGLVDIEVYQSTNFGVEFDFPRALLEELLNDINLQYKQFNSASSKEEKLDLIEKEAYKLFQEFDLINFNRNGIVLGLLAATKADDKKRILKLQNIDEKIQAIKDLKIDDKTLRSKFEYAKYNLKKNEVSVAKVIELLENVVTSEKRIISLLYTYTLVSVDYYFFGKDIRAVSIVKAIELLINNKENTFFEKVQDWVSINLKLKKGIVAKRLKEILALSMKSLNVKSKGNSEKIKLFSIREVPPYYGIFRGCIGGDCSTSRSWPFPFSPAEHVYYIYNNNNRAVAYMTMTEVEVSGKKAIYIKDVSGRSLSPDIAEKAIHAISLTKGYYDAEKVMLATYRFVHAENHYSGIKNVLSKYNKDKEVQEQKLIDLELREYLGGFTRYGTTYDGADYHTWSVEFEPDQNVLSSIDVEFSLADKKNIKSSSNSYDEKSLWENFEIVMRESDRSLGDVPISLHTKIQYLVNIFDNINRAELEVYYDLIESELKKFDLVLSNSFLKKHSSLLFRGHLRSIDALNTNDEKLLNRSDRFLSQVLAGQDYTWLSGLFKGNEKVLTRFEKLNARIERYNSHGEKETFKKVKFLADEKIPLAMEYLAKNSNISGFFIEDFNSYFSNRGNSGNNDYLFEEEELNAFKESIANVNKMDGSSYLQTLESLLGKYQLNFSDLESIGLSDVVIQAVMTIKIDDKADKLYKSLLLPIIQNYILSDNINPQAMLHLSRRYVRLGYTKQKLNPFVTALIEKLKSLNNDRLLHYRTSLYEFAYLGKNKLAYDYLNSVDHLEALKQSSSDLKEDIVSAWILSNNDTLKTVPELVIEKALVGLDNENWLDEDLIYSKLSIQALVDLHMKYNVEFTDDVIKELQASFEREDDKYIRLMSQFLLLKTGYLSKEDNIDEFLSLFKESDLPKNYKGLIKSLNELGPGKAACKKAFKGQE